ncbi:hypothetical protein KO500_05755 [Cellulophaga baltica]|uniref:hypothetical protein n=1 Tax=Cellulophaga TaxID=104264 RepID=UPI001C06A4F4|nr:MULTISPECIES: hypothetical protein [Cellulophaga]MBU2995926.1 hypothetical protein [Cellulophaga baltica]MDO6767321.1 hypothetical protein [Cellulophaga sp. 1_MG-2023]
MSKRNIDELFKEQFKDFDAIPDEKIWSAIETSLEKKKSRKIIPVWWKLGGVAAVLAGFIFTIQLFKNEFSDSDIEITNSKTNSYKEHKNLIEEKGNKNLSTIKSDSNQTNKKEKINYRKEPSYVVDEIKNTNQNIKNVGLNNSHKSSTPVYNEIVGDSNKNNASGANFNDNNTVVSKDENESNKEILVGQGQTKNSAIASNHNKAKEGISNKNDVAVDEGVGEKEFKKKSIFDEIYKDDEETVEVEKIDSKWSVGPSVAPVYFNSLGEGSSFNESFVQNAKSGEVNLSYGVSVAYEVSKKLKIRSGIHKVEYGYTTNQIEYTSSFNNESIGKLENISYNSNATNIAVSSSLNNIDSELIVSNDVTAKSSSYEGGLLQQFGYIEVPFELNYALIDKRFGFDVIGGLSSLFLIDNSVYLNSGDQRTEVGEANNINSINFSTNVGFGFNYKITEKFMFNVEPLFKYQLNTFSNTSGEFQPFSLGIYSGVNYKF